MTDLTIEREIIIEAPADVVWRTITEPDQIAQWFADRAELELRPGGDGTFVFEDKAKARSTSVVLVVETVDAPRRFSFRWAQPEGETPTPVNSVLVEFTLVAEDRERTRLRVVETGLDVIRWSDDDKARYVDEHRNGWSTCFARLGELFVAPTG